MLKSEKREKIKRNRGKMVVSGRGLFNLLRIMREARLSRFIQNKAEKTLNNK